MDGAGNQKFFGRLEFLLAGLALALRLALFSFATPRPGAFLDEDSEKYLSLARGLAQEGCFRNVEGPEIFRVPGYPAFLLLFRLFGEEGWVAAVVIAQILLDLGVCLLTLRLARRVLPRPGAVPLALAWQAVSGASAVYSCKVLSETLFTFFFLLFLLSALEGSLRKELTLADRSSRSALKASLCLAAMLHLRTIAMPLAILFPLERALRRQYRAALLSLLVVAGSLAPWTLRNWLVAGHAGFSTTNERNLYFYSAGALLADLHGTSLAEEQAAFAGELVHLDAVEGARVSKARALEILAAHPWRYLWIHLRSVPLNLLPAEGGALRMFGFTVGQNRTQAVILKEGLLAGVRRYFDRAPAAALLLVPAALLLLLKYLGAAAGGISLLRLGAPLAGFLIALEICLLVYPGPASHPRFRVPIEPILSIQAAQGLLLVLDRLRARRVRAADSYELKSA